MSKTQNILYWVATGLISAMMLISAVMYFVDHANVSATFTALGFPTYIIYPLAIAKVLAIAVILSGKWCYC